MRHVIKRMPHPHAGMQPNACYTYKTKTNNESHESQPAGYSLVKQVQVEEQSGEGGTKNKRSLVSPLPSPGSSLE
jgi:hypothetical protein